MFGGVRIKVCRGNLLGKHRSEPSRSVRCGGNTLPNTSVRFSTNSMSVPDAFHKVTILYTGGIYPTKVVRYGLNTLPNTLPNNIYGSIRT